jgi:hypothetical protein
LDEACKLEGMLETVRAKQQDLQRSLDEVQQLSNGLRDKIHFESKEPEVHPVIAHPRLIEEDMVTQNNENERSGPAATNPVTPPKIKQGTGSFSTDELALTGSAGSSGIVDMGIHGVHRPRHPNAMTIHSSALTNMDRPYMGGPSTGLPSYRVNTEDEFHGITLGFGCGTSLFGERLIESQNLGDDDSLMALSFDSFVDDAQTIGGVSSGATASSHHAMHGVSGDNHAPESPLRSGSFDGINFRTGMSGHRGLSQAKKKASPCATRELPKMSAHMGIGVGRSARRVNSPAQHSPARYVPSPDRIRDPYHRINQHDHAGVHLG